jgi:hypothetical protein
MVLFQARDVYDLQASDIEDGGVGHTTNGIGINFHW